MEEARIIERGVTVLEAPPASVEIVSENGQRAVFDIAVPENAGIPGLRDYAVRLIRIPTASLEIGTAYYVKTSVPIVFRDSDEGLFTYGCTKDGQTFAVSFPNPNDIANLFPEDSGTELQWYDFRREAPEGRKAVSFRLTGREEEFIFIAAAWIWNITEDTASFESAAEVMTWIV